MNTRLPRPADEQGFAIVIAITTLTVTIALAAALVTASGTFLHSSSRDSANKRALAAAEAGLNAGLYRFGRISQAPSGSFANNCVSDREVAWSSVAPHCPAATGYFNMTGAASSYYLTPDMSASLPGMSTVATECASSGPGDRCLTAIGTVNGVTRRVQERIRILELFSIHGMVGLEQTEINSSGSWSGPNFQVTSDTGSNGPITYGQNVSPPGEPYHCEYYEKPPGPGPGSAPCGSQNVPRKTPITVPSVETLPFGATQTTNENGKIAAGYTAATRSLSVAAGTTLTLGAGDYNFCSVALGNGATLSAAPTARVRIFVDSPSRAGSGCASGGTFNAAATGARLNLGESQGQLEIYLWGTVPAVAEPPPKPPGSCKADFTFNNTAKGPSSALYVYAPDSIVTIKSSAYQLGAVVGCRTSYWAEASTARWDYPPSGTRPSSGVGAVSGSFRECTPQYSGDPESSCG